MLFRSAVSLLLEIFMLNQYSHVQKYWTHTHMPPLFFTFAPYNTFRLSLIPNEPSALLSDIEMNVRKLEQSVPFPCTKSAHELRYIARGKHRGKFEVSLTVTHEKTGTQADAVRHLENAGFSHVVRV